MLLAGSAGGGQLVPRDHHRAERQERIRALGPQPLSVALLAGPERLGLTLPVARGDVVGRGVAGNVGRGIRNRHAAGAAPDDDRQFGLQIEGVRAGRVPDRIAVGGHGVGEHREEHGARRALQALLADMLEIVVADADDLAGARDRRYQPDRPGVKRGRLHFVLVRGRDGVPEGAQVRIDGQHRRQIHPPDLARQPGWGHIDESAEGQQPAARKNQRRAMGGARRPVADCRPDRHESHRRSSSWVASPGWVARSLST